MKTVTVVYPGPGVEEQVGKEPTLHPGAGILKPGPNEVKDSVAKELVAAGLCSWPRRGTAPAPEPAREEEQPASRPRGRREE